MRVKQSTYLIASLPSGGIYLALIFYGRKHRTLHAPGFFRLSRRIVEILWLLRWEKRTL